MRASNQTVLPKDKKGRLLNNFNSQLVMLSKSEENKHSLKRLNMLTTKEPQNIFPIQPEKKIQAINRSK